MTSPLELRALTRDDLALVRSWFEDADTQRFLGGPDWPERMLELGEQSIGQEFRGAVQTGMLHYLATVAEQPVGYVDCGTTDRWAVYDEASSDGPIRETRDLITGYLAMCVDPAGRRQGVGRAMLAALVARPEVAAVRRFAAGVEPANQACVRCLHAAGFRPYSTEPDYEDMLYYVFRPLRADRPPGTRTGRPQVLLGRRRDDQPRVLRRPAIHEWCHVTCSAMLPGCSTASGRGLLLHSSAGPTTCQGFGGGVVTHDHRVVQPQALRVELGDGATGSGR